MVMRLDKIPIPVVLGEQEEFELGKGKDVQHLHKPHGHRYFTPLNHWMKI
jgi:hypothetical protein